MDTPRKTRSAPEWPELEPGTGVRPCAPAGDAKLDPDTAYWIGLVCQVITDAGSERLTLAELEIRTKLDTIALLRVLEVAVEREVVGVDRGVYFGKE